MAHHTCFLILFSFFNFIICTCNASHIFETYDEVFDEKGNVRPVYKIPVDIITHYSTQNVSSLSRRTLKDFQGDNALHPLPRMLTTEENEILRKGVSQRAQALRAFLDDHYSGQKRYLKENVIPDQVIKRVLHRSGDDVLMGKISPDQIQFWYGPDIVRVGVVDQQGNVQSQFRIIEDNTGNLGGMGDLLKARKSLFKRFSDYADIPLDPNSNPRLFYDQMIAYYQSLIQNDEVIVHLRNSNKLCIDKEDDRIEKILKSYKIETVYLDKPKKYKLKIGRDEVLLKSSKGKIQKVGLIIVDGHPTSADPSHPLVKKAINIEILKSIREDLMENNEEVDLIEIDENLTNSQYSTVSVRRFLNQNYSEYVGCETDGGINGLFNVWKNNKVKIINSPGTEFLSDKELYIYIEDIIRFYLKEEPILKNMDSFSFEKTNGQFNQDLSEIVFSRNYRKWVVKKVDGCGGNGVWIGPKSTKRDFFKLIEDIKKSPRYYIAQRYSPLSQIDGNIVDLRLHAHVGVNKVVVSTVPWGRGTPFSGNGKVNISDKGKEFTVLVSDPNQCRKRKSNYIVTKAKRRRIAHD